jgi:hypothetical protein
MLRKGILMGDPLTKVILHLINILVRVTGANYASPGFIEKIFPMESGSITDYINRYSATDPSGAYAPSVVPILEEASSSNTPVTMTDIGKHRDIPLPTNSRKEPTLRKVPNDSEISELYKGLTFNLERVLYPEGRKPSEVQHRPEKEDNLLPERDRFLKFENLQISALLRSMQMEREKTTLQSQRDREVKELRRRVANMRFNLSRPTQPVMPATKVIPFNLRRGKRANSKPIYVDEEEEEETPKCFNLRHWI